MNPFRITLNKSRIKLINLQIYIVWVYIPKLFAKESFR